MKINFIFKEGPIARAYLKIFNEKKYKNFLGSIIILNSNYFLPNFIKLKLNFNQKNFWPTQFLKDKKNNFFISQVEKFFKFKKNFCREMYYFNNLSLLKKKIIYVNSDSINNSKTINLVKKQKGKFFLISDKEILKDILKTNKKFLHIHPGYLPETRGADCSLWSIMKNKNVGVSIFIVNKKIDKGKIILRSKISSPKFKFKVGNTKKMYRLWYSFFDPLLRASLLQSFLNKMIRLNKKKESKMDLEKYELKDKKPGSYFTFMKNQELKKVFNQVFYD